MKPNQELIRCEQLIKSLNSQNQLRLFDFILTETKENNLALAITHNVKALRAKVKFMSGMPMSNISLADITYSTVELFVSKDILSASSILEHLNITYFPTPILVPLSVDSLCIH